MALVDDDDDGGGGGAEASLSLAVVDDGGEGIATVPFAGRFSFLPPTLLLGKVIESVTGKEP